MKISHRWLGDFIELTENIQEISESLTSIGLEVESIERAEAVKGGLEGLVIGQVLECEQHPNADRLRITKVDIGGPESLQIVCGAPNVAKGQKVIVAPVGTTVHPTNGESFRINKSKIRSEVSEGMICAEDEIGLGESHDGIKILPGDAPIGKLLKEYFNLSSDTIYEIGLTPNRADAASHLGVARDLAAIFNTSLKPQNYTMLPVKEAGKIKIKLSSLEDCPRFAGIYIEGVEVKESPKWLKDRLTAIGVKSINNIVDVTNFICHGLGQPMHAYNADALKGNTIVVRRAETKEKLQTLDQVEREMKGGELVIADTEQIVGIAGTMGGLLTSVNNQTKNIYLESAYFQPALVRKSSKAHDLKTDASFRFERGTDPDMCSMALSYALELIIEVAGGIPEPFITDVYPHPIAPIEIELNYDYAQRLIGKKIETKTMLSILNGLGIKTLEEKGNSVNVRVPLAKVDVTRPCDLVEEILRIYGLNNIEMPTHLKSSLSFSKKPDAERVKEILSEFLSSIGYQEMMSNSLTSSKNNELLNNADQVEILNPLSIELQALRNQMLSSGLEAISYNINRKQNDLKLYEWGSTYHLNDGAYSEKWKLSLFLSGNTHGEHWSEKAEKNNLFNLKSVVDRLLNRLSLSYTKLQEINEGAYQGFSYNIGKLEILKVTSVAKKVLKQFDINQDVFFADIDMKALMTALEKRKMDYKGAPKYPSVRRDLSMLIGKSVSFEQLKKIAGQAEQRLLKKVDIFDVYEGDKVPAGKKSYALSFILMDEEKTLQDQIIDGVMDKLIKSYEKEVGAEIRKA
jgi:phenylalanyl-tRNA synthetase beta chain